MQAGAVLATPTRSLLYYFLIVKQGYSEIAVVSKWKCKCILACSDTFTRVGQYCSLHYTVGTRTVATQESGTSTIRHANCTVLVPSNQKSDRCHSCQVFRSSLRSSLSKLNRAEASSSSRVEPQSRTPLRCLTKDELTTRFRNLKTVHTSTVRQLGQMKRNLEAAIDKSGVKVDESTHSDLAEIMTKQHSAVAAKYPPDSFPRIFWEQQLKMATIQDSRGRRWHPVMIKWALYLQHQSSSSYETLRSSGCFSLPSQRTLRDYSHCIKASAGFSDEVDMQLVRAPEVANAQEWQR